MRPIFAIGAAVVAVLTFATPGKAEVNYPYCLYDREGGVNCGFVSLQQCMASKGGNSDMCMINGLYQPGQAAAPRKKKRPRSN